jgi:hypothetical protein
MTLPYSLVAQQAAPAASASPAAPANPITMSEKGLSGFMSGAVIRAAEKMPEENYGFKPTPEVRSFGQLASPVPRCEGPGAPADSWVDRSDRDRCAKMTLSWR